MDDAKTNMSFRNTYSRSVLQRLNDRKKRKLAIDESGEISIDDFVTASAATPDSQQINMIEDSQSSLKGHRDLFGEIIPDNKCASEPVSKCTRITKKNNTERKRKKQQCEDFSLDSPINRPTRVFIPTPRIIRIMKEAQTELYSLMGLNNSSNDVSVISTDSLNVSGVQHLQDSPRPTAQKEKKSETNPINNESDEKRAEEISQIFKGRVRPNN